MLKLKLAQIIFVQVVIIFMVLLARPTGACAQTSSQYDKGTPPQQAAGISSLGSYTSADVGTVNLSNGAMNIRLPVVSIGGRGFSVPLTLNYSSKVWSASRDSSFADTTGNHPVAYANYADIENLMDIYSRVGPGWTIGATPTLVMRANGIKNNSTTTCVGDFKFVLTKLTVILPDKGEIQLRDDSTDGAPLAAQLDPNSQCTWRDGNRGQRWHAGDGSGIVFISDTPNGIVRGDLNGVLILADGTSYRFASLFNPPAGSPALDVMGTARILARGTSITDRNGNVISITYPAANEVRYTDQLNRITKIQKNVPDPDNASVTLAFLVTVSGYQGQNRYYKLKSAVMNQRYRSGINPTLPVINGDYDPLGWGLSWGAATRLFPHSHGLDAERIDVMTVLSQFVLPDGRAVEFFYNEFGEVAEVRLATGGKLQYDYQYVSTLPAGASHIGEVKTSYFDSDVGDVDRAVVARRTYADGTTLEGSWTYSYTNTVTQVTALSATASVLLNEKHYFMTAARYLNSPSGTGPVPDRGVEGTGYSLWSTGVESRTESLDASGAAVLAAREQDWTQRAAVGWAAFTTYAQEQPENDNRINQIRKYLENGQMAKVETFYDQYNNPIEVKEYDFDQTLKRRTVTSYVASNNGFNYQTDDSIHLLALPKTQTVYDGNGNQRAQTVSEYDNYTDDTNHAPLFPYASVSQHDSSYDNVNKKTRGNPTQVGNWLNTTSSFIYRYPRYDILSNVVGIKDARGNVSTIKFADDFGNGSNPGTPTQNPATPTYALPTLITSPPPTAGAPVQTAQSQYDYASGLLTGFRDRNNVVTQTLYNDAFDRPTQVISALGVAAVQSRTLMYYAPAFTPFGITLTNNDVLTASDQTVFSDSELRSWTVTDAFGRTKESWSRDPQGDVKVVTIYDALGRPKQVSNPFRPSLGETAAYSTTVYDLLGRVKTVSTPDAATVTTSYTANTVTVTDQAGKARKSVTDALGRLIEVYEDPSGANYQTKYTYDVLDSLVKVEQGSQSRFFMYDSLKRLIRADNPEQETLSSLDLSDPITSHTNWTASYDYDSNGNLTSKTDARGVVTYNVYDALNRLTTVLYRVNGQPDPNTGDIEYLYDNATNGKGRLWLTYRWGAKPSQTSIGQYDAMGRLKQFYNLFGDGQGGWSTGYEVNRNYNLAGQVTSQTYPSGRTVSYSYDTAGRTSSFTGNLGDGVTRSYASSFIYNARSQVTQELFGTQTQLYHKLQYNIRGQLWDVRVSTNPDVNGSRNRGGLQYFYDSSLGYGTSGPDNNGNVLFANTYTPEDEQDTKWAIHRQRYAYDSLNRLKSVTEYFVNYAQPESQQSVQTYDYDRWGNRTINAAQTSGNGINNKAFDVETARNRLYSPGDLVPQLPENDKRIRYDKAGNQIKDTYTGYGTATYDGDNHIVAIQDKFANSSTYTYNANAQRVRRRINNQETWQIYGIDGELVAEYAANGAVGVPQKEYGYRDGQLLITAEPAAAQNVSWTNIVGVSANANNLTKTASTLWGNAGASSTQSLSSGDAYVEATATETSSARLFGFSHTDINQNWSSIDFGLDMDVNGTIWIFEAGNNRGTFGTYATGDKLRVSIEGGVVKYKKNGTVLYTSSMTPVYPLIVDTALYQNGTTLSNVVLGSGGPKVQWLVPDHLGTPRIILDQTGSIANLKRHDHLPFGEELPAGTGGRTAAMGYVGGDNVRQQFTQKERDVENGLDYFGARYYAGLQGRFTGADPLFIEANRLVYPQSWNLYAYTRNNPLRFIDPDGLEIAVKCEVKGGCQKTVENLNNRKDAQFQTELKDGKLKLVGQVDEKKLSKSELALYQAITNTDTVATLEVVSSSDKILFGYSELNNIPPVTGLNRIDQGDLNQLDQVVAGEIVAHEAIEAFGGKKGLSNYQLAHAYANTFFGDIKVEQVEGLPEGAQVATTARATLNFRRLQTKVSIEITLTTPQPAQSLPNRFDYLQGNIKVVKPQEKKN